MIKNLFGLDDYRASDERLYAVVNDLYDITQSLNRIQKNCGEQKESLKELNKNLTDYRTELTKE